MPPWVLLPTREPREALVAMRQTIGSMNYAAQYQQTTVPASTDVPFREPKMSAVDPPPAWP